MRLSRIVRAGNRTTERATGQPSGQPTGQPKSIIFKVFERNGLQKRYNLNGFERATGQPNELPRSTESNFAHIRHECLRATVRTYKTFVF